MATSTLKNQLQSAQKNLLFLQREHANTLKGLHEELRRLQQRCTGTCSSSALKPQGKAHPQLPLTNPPTPKRVDLGPSVCISWQTGWSKPRFFHLFFMKLIVQLFYVFANLQWISYSCFGQWEVNSVFIESCIYCKSVHHVMCRLCDDVLTKINNFFFLRFNLWADCKEFRLVR